MVEYQIRRSTLPLAVCREVAAHLEQVDGVEVTLLPQQASQFNYLLSQVDSLVIRHPEHLSAADRNRVEQILAYYSDRYGAWEVLAPNPAAGQVE